MKYYMYSSDTFEYLGEREAHVAPGREALPANNMAKWLIPASATTKKPANTGNNQIAVFSIANNAWYIEPDFRGQKVYSIHTGEESTVNAIGALSNTTLIPQPNTWYTWNEANNSWDDNENERRLHFSRLINHERARRILQGCEATGIAANNIYIQGSEQDKTNLQGLVTAAQIRLSLGDTTTQTPFRDGRNNTYMLTPAQIIALWQAGASYVSAVYQASWSLKDNPPIPEDYANNSYWPVAQWPQP